METNVNQKVSCMVNFAYDASEPDELTIRPGDTIRDVERLSGGWWKGELRGRRGMFPDNFVSVLDQDNARSTGVQGRCRAVFSYQPANPDELPLCVGDVLEVLGEVEEGWWQGRRQGRVGVFPSNFVVMLDPLQPAPPYEPAPALPPKPVKELCRVLFPYSAVNEDELTLSEGDIVTIVSRDAPDRGWWRGELHGRVGLFPDNFVQLLPPVAADLEEKKPERPPAKTTNAIYPILNKYTEKTASVKELTTSKISTHKENTISKETSTQSTVTHTNKSESEKLIHNETVNDGTLEQLKKPPVPLKKSPTPSSGVGSLLSELKNKMLPSTDKEKSPPAPSGGSGSSSGGEWDRPDGGVASRSSVTPAPANTNSTNNNANSTNTFDRIERNSILNDPRAARVKAPRRRPPSQILRDDSTTQIGLSNGHEVTAEKPTSEKAEEIKPRAREWEKHKAPWMEELKLNQAKKTSFGADGKPRPVAGAGDGSVACKAGGGSTDRILDCGLEEKRSTHSMEMSKSTSSISSRMSVLESYEEAQTTKVRHSLDSRREATPPAAAARDLSPPVARPAHSPTAAGRTLISMLDDIKKPPAPAPPSVSPLSAPVISPATTDKSLNAKPDKSPNAKLEKSTVNTEKQSELNSVKLSSSIFEKTSTLERIEREEKLPEKPVVMSGVVGEKVVSGSVSDSLERRTALKTDVNAHTSDGTDAKILQLNNRILNLENLIQTQHSMFQSAIDDLRSQLKRESELRQALQLEVEKLGACVTQV